MMITSPEAMRLGAAAAVTDGTAAAAPGPTRCAWIGHDSIVSPPRWSVFICEG
jgi:hypothetical protein